MVPSFAPEQKGYLATAKGRQFGRWERFGPLCANQSDIRKTKEYPMGRPVVLGIGTLIILLLVVAYFF